MKTDLAIKIEDLTVAYKENPVLWDIDVEVPAGIMMAIVGPNGSGKTTLIKSALGLIEPVAGKIEFFGNSYKKMKKIIGYVPQRNSVDWDFPTTVFDVALMGTYGRLNWFKRPGKKEKYETLEALEKVGMEKFKDRQISQLSGGQQQRVFLARALLQNAEIYFMDEPFQGVDATTERAIINILKELKSMGKTVVCVHHDLHTLKEYFDWITLLNVRKIESGPADEVLTDDNLKKTFGGKLSFLTTHSEDEIDILKSND